MTVQLLQPWLIAILHRQRYGCAWCICSQRQRRTNMNCLHSLRWQTEVTTMVMMMVTTTTTVLLRKIESRVVAVPPWSLQVHRHLWLPLPPPLLLLEEESKLMALQRLVGRAVTPSLVLLRQTRARRSAIVQLIHFWKSTSVCIDGGARWLRLSKRGTACESCGMLSVVQLLDLRCQPLLVSM